MAYGGTIEDRMDPTDYTDEDMDEDLGDEVGFSGRFPPGSVERAMLVIWLGAVAWLVFAVAAARSY